MKRLIKSIPFASIVYQFVMRRVDYLSFISDFRQFRRLLTGRNRNFNLKWRDRFPCLADKTATTVFDRHYIYHLGWAARILARIRPEKHVDISSLLHFSAITSAFIPIDFYDYRPADLRLTNFSSKQADLQSLPFSDGSISSISCMHVVEHIGLGRYGDAIDPDGDLIAISELKRVLANNGDLLFVVPIGKARIVFNAHRIYSYEQIISAFNGLSLKEFSLIPDRSEDGDLIINANEALANVQNYGCGCFWFKKNSNSKE